MTGNLFEWRKARNQMLRDLDIDAARVSMGAWGKDDAFILLCLHKARYDCVNLTDAERRESARWLADGNHTDMQGHKIDPDAPLRY